MVNWDCWLMSSASDYLLSNNFAGSRLLQRLLRWKKCDEWYIATDCIVNEIYHLQQLWIILRSLCNNWVNAKMMEVHYMFNSVERFFHLSTRQARWPKIHILHYDTDSQILPASPQWTDGVMLSLKAYYLWDFRRDCPVCHEQWMVHHHPWLAWHDLWAA